MSKDDIVNILHTLEKEENIEIIYACELGSRAWGFSNDQSNYNVRFIFKRSDFQDYLKVKNVSDTLECSGDDLDIIGWDIKMALELHFKDDLYLRECLLSGEVYIDNGVERIFSGLDAFNMDVLKNSYREMALDCWRQYTSLEFNKSKTRKYLHVIRSILAWNLLNMEIYPPIELLELLGHEHIHLSDEIISSVHELIDCHQDRGSLNEDSVFRLNNFILSSLNHMEKVNVESLKDILDYYNRFEMMIC